MEAAQHYPPPPPPPWKSDVEISVLKVNKGLIRWNVSTGFYIAKDISS